MRGDNKDQSVACCPICLEEYSSRFSYHLKRRLSTCTTSTSTSTSTSPSTSRNRDEVRGIKVQLSGCCQQHICSQCLYAHIKSILEEGIVLNGRTTLACPLNCGATLTDAAVRQSFALTSRYIHNSTATSQTANQSRSIGKYFDAVGHLRKLLSSIIRPRVLMLFCGCSCIFLPSIQTFSHSVL